MRSLFPVATIIILGLLLLSFPDGSRAKGKCSTKDLAITQSFTGRRPNGIPIYSVEIANLCAAGCPISNIHLHCGAFSSSTLINPNQFKRIAIDDCLINNAKPLAQGKVISFTYTTNFMHPLAVKSAKITC
ncbi:protein TAPETUM DETERMINANT 1-like [Mangifera indica]|uniref:protein TAPETUM DETERMINANT 1-like n=1 Tax=Mangifera indica TaxID=29780 RepID=UPI001CFB25D7|nr:protein TAPETUM DETERMINANT 1-like [Mangifera indica]